MTDILTHNDESILLEITDDDIWAIMEQQAQEQYAPGYDYWKDKRVRDISFCGYLKWIENAKNGMTSYKIHLCEEPDCPYCGPKIREEMRKGLEKALGDNSLRKIVLTGSVDEIKAQRAKITRKYGKDKISSFGIDTLSETGLGVSCEMLVATEDEIGEEYKELKQEDIEKWSRKSFQLKKSGNLHKDGKQVTASSGSKSEDYEIRDGEGQIEVESWIVSTKDPKVLQEIEKEVLAETPDLNPKTIAELKLALQIRRNLRMKKLEEREIVILSNDKRIITIREKDINWKPDPKPEPTWKDWD